MKPHALIAIAIVLATVFLMIGASSDVDINMLRGCTDGDVAAWDNTNKIWDCSPFATGSAITFDIGDDGGDDSTDINEIATTGDTNSIFTESSPDKILVAVGSNWPTADTATTASGLVSNGANCSAGFAPLGVDAAGAVESCFDVVVSTEIDTEAELESILGDVSDVFTANDTVDISSYTNLAVTAPVVLTDDTLSLNQNGGTDITADLEEEAHASEHASGGGDLLYGEREAVWQQTGDVSTAMDIENIRLYARQSGTIIDAFCSVNTAGTTDAIIVDFNKNGTTIFTTQASRVQIAATAYYDASAGPDVTTYSANDYFTIEIDQADTGDTGADLSCQLQVKEAVTQ